MDWELVEVEDVECTVDDSGLHVVINRVVTPRTEGTACTFRIRADLMQADDPIVSFIGTANNVRKHLIQYIFENYGCAVISTEHASYLGYELHRAETTPNYVQD